MLLVFFAADYSSFNFLSTLLFCRTTPSTLSHSHSRNSTPSTNLYVPGQTLTTFLVKCKLYFIQMIQCCVYSCARLLQKVSGMPLMIGKALLLLTKFLPNSQIKGTADDPQIKCVFVSLFSAPRPKRSL